MRIGDVLRYPSLRDVKAQQRIDGAVYEEIDGMPNFHWLTAAPDGTLCQLEKGITPVRRVKGAGVDRVPAVLISASSHKAGSRSTPWQNHFDPDSGFARYFGDARPGAERPAEQSPGNAVLLRQAELHQSFQRTERLQAAPLVLFEAVPHAGRQKGFRRFHGFGIITKCERVVQRGSVDSTSFANYRYDFCIFDLAAEEEQFSWDWINARRSASWSDEATLDLAPDSWKRWVDSGPDGVHKVRRRVATLRTVSKAAQTTLSGPSEASQLRQIYRYFDGKKTSFESLAETVTDRIMNESGVEYRMGWITQGSGDGGADFVGRLDVGQGLARTKLVVLGQAKCVRPDSAAGGRELARLVARLRRGWLGVFVTTGYFSRQVQVEVLEDRYPIMLVNGREVVRAVSSIMHERGSHDLAGFLESVHRGYRDRVRVRMAEEILFDD